MNDLRRPLSEMEMLVLEFIHQNPNYTHEDITEKFISEFFYEDFRDEIGSAVEYLVMSDYCNRNPITQAITKRAVD